MNTPDSGSFSDEALNLYAQLVEMALSVPDTNYLAAFASPEGWPCSARECSLIAEHASKHVLAPWVLLYVEDQFVLCLTPPVTLSPNLFPVWQPSPA